MKKLLIGLFFLTSTLSYADSLSLNVHFDVTEYYNVDGDKLSGDYAVISGDVGAVVKSDGQIVTDYKEVIPPMKDSIKTQMEIVGENKVRLIVESENIDVVVPANIEKSGGQLVSLTVASEDVLAVMGEVFKQEGMALLRKFEMNVNDDSFGVNLTATDTVCTKLAEQLSCKGSIDITIEIIEN